jgi:hypothetical protein
MFRAFLKLSKESECLGRESSEIASSGGQITELEFSNQESQNEIIQASHDPSRIWFAHPGMVFMQGDISAVMQAILNPPIRANQA